MAPSLPDTMRAVVIDRHGGPEVLTVREVERPRAGPGQVVVEVHAAGVNPVDAQNRADGAWGGIRLPAILGSDAAGVVVEVGPGVEDVDVDDEVYAFAPFRGGTSGTYAEYVALSAAHVAHRPATIDHVTAAAVPLAGATALAVVHDRLEVRAGERLLVHGAAGGVGLFAVQLAKIRGATVVGSASARRAELLARMGVDHHVDYAAGDVGPLAVAAAGGELDAVADLVGGLLPGVLPHVRPGGRLASITTLAGDFDEAVDRNHVLHGVLVQPAAEPLRRLAALIDDGTLTPLVDATFPLADVASAHRRVESGHGQGKVVLQIREDR